MKDKLQTRRKYSQTAYLTKNLYLEFIKDFQNPTVRKQIIPLENGQKTQADISPRGINRWANKQVQSCSTSLAVKKRAN